MRSAHLQLRALEPADIDLLYKWENDTDIWHLSNTLTPFSRFALEQYVLNASDDLFTTRQVRMMIELHKEDPARTIGCVDIFDFEPFNQRAGVGIMIIEAERGKGFASEALDLIIDYSFNLLNLHQLYSNVIASNTSSLELFKRKHFSEIGVKKDWLRVKDTWVDEYLLQLINDNS